MNNTKPKDHELFDLAIAQQRDFDAIAAEHGKNGDRMIALRAEMLALLSGIDVRLGSLSAVSATPEPGDADHIAELKSANLDAAAKFDRAAAAYVAELHASRARNIALRDTLAAFLTTRAQLHQFGTQPPDLIEHEELARVFEPHARKVANLPPTSAAV
jgi:hypothetical protein